jgi:hypothetical protein
MIQINGATTGTITQAQLFVIYGTTAHGLSMSSWIGGQTANHNGDGIAAATTNNNVISPASNSTFMSCSGMITRNANSNNGATCLVLRIDGTAGGTTKIINGYFYAMRIA